jgi:hypothetical protein
MDAVVPCTARPAGPALTARFPKDPAMTYGAYQMQPMLAAGSPRAAFRIRPSAPWSAGLGTKPCTHVVTDFGDIANHRQPEEAPL